MEISPYSSNAITLCRSNLQSVVITYGNSRLQYIPINTDIKLLSCMLRFVQENINYSSVP